MWCRQTFSSISLFNNKFLILSFQAEIAAVRDYLAQMVTGAELVGKQFHSSGTHSLGLFYATGQRLCLYVVLHFL